MLLVFQIPFFSEICNAQYGFIGHRALLNPEFEKFLIRNPDLVTEAVQRTRHEGQTMNAMSQLYGVLTHREVIKPYDEAVYDKTQHSSSLEDLVMVANGEKLPFNRTINNSSDRAIPRSLWQRVGRALSV